MPSPSGPLVSAARWAAVRRCSARDAREPSDGGAAGSRHAVRVGPRSLLTAVVAALLVLLAAESAYAARPLRPSAFVTIVGAARGDRAGTSVAAAGDVNGDRILDLIVGAPHAGGGAGMAYVVFGSRRHRVVRLSRLRRRGFAIVGDRGSGAGGSVAGAGDVNRDGLDDVIVGAPKADPLARHDAGAAYVVFGKRSSAGVRVASLGSHGYAIDGAVKDGRTGAAVAGAGDLDRDRRPDVLVSAPGIRSDVPGGNGGVYVVSGKADPVTVDLASPASSAYVMVGVEDIGPAAARVGDVNGDHRPDIAVRVSLPFDEGADGAFFLFGGRYSGDVQVTGAPSTATPARGFLRTGGAFTNSGGSALAGVGDVNRDGLADTLVGARYEGCSTCPGGTRPSRRQGAGGAYLAFGSASERSTGLDDKSAGAHFNGPRPGGELGASVSRAGDVDGDGVQDFAFGAPGPSRSAVFRGDRERFPGSVFVVFGSRHPRSLDLAQLGLRGFELRGQARDHAGESLASVGDINRDRHPDLVVGAPGADHGRGAAYVVSLRR